MRSNTAQGPMKLPESPTKSIPYRPLPPIQTVFAPPSQPQPKVEPLTDKQIENWRMHLLRVVGPIALIMNRDEIERVRNGVQEMFAPLAESIGGQTEQVPSVEPTVTSAGSAPGASSKETPSLQSR